MPSFFSKFKRSSTDDNAASQSETHGEGADDSAQRTVSRRSHNDIETYWDPNHAQVHYRRRASTYEIADDPVDFVKEALVPIFSFTKKKGMDIGTCPFMTDPVCMHRKLTVTAATETVRTEHIPIYFAKGYVHRVNGTPLTSETDGGALRIVETLRNRFIECKIRFRQDVIDTSAPVGLEAASVGLVYEIIGEVKYKDGFVDEKRTTVVAIFRIENGKLVNGDLVVDRGMFKDLEQKDLDCVIQ